MSGYITGTIRNSIDLEVVGYHLLEVESESGNCDVLVPAYLKPGRKIRFSTLYDKSSVHAPLEILVISTDEDWSHRISVAKDHASVYQNAGQSHAWFYDKSELAYGRPRGPETEDRDYARSRAIDLYRQLTRKRNKFSPITEQERISRLPGRLCMLALSRKKS